MQHSNQRPTFEDPAELLPRAVKKLYSVWLRLTYPFASIGRDVSFHWSSKVSRERAWGVSLGNSVSIGEHAWLNVAIDHSSGERAGEPTIVIDDNCIVAFGSILSARNRIHLERYVNVAQQVLIMDHNHSYEDIEIPILQQGITKGGTIRIGEGSWIGHGAAVVCSRGELTIGRHCVIAANSVVTRSIPDYSVVFGNPATIIRQYDPETRTWRMGQVRRAGAARGENSVKPDALRPEAELMEKP